MFMCVVNRKSVNKLDLTWKQSFLILPIPNNTYQFQTVLTNSKQYQTVTNNIKQTWYRLVPLGIDNTLRIVANKITVSSWYHHDTVLAIFN